ncbi:VanZ family protein [Rhodohalobacter sp.]|uniref:VanZ family protein n=1 Tax=Rhodohalobacter sp. TaxID=1974210 RepID=UPI002ACDA120|nr:VanZ family protein [Rhodohalobacter sp.]
MTKNKKVIYTLFILITVAIFALTLLPANRLGSNRLFQYDKLGHFMMFFSWTFLFGLLHISRKREESNLVFIFFAGALFGIGIEILQGLMSFGRSIDLYDAIADIFGTITATFLLFLTKPPYPPE